MSETAMPVGRYACGDVQTPPNRYACGDTQAAVGRFTCADAQTPPARTAFLYRWDSTQLDFSLDLASVPWFDEG